MSFTDIAISRRSVRKFLDESIAPELIDSLLIAAQAAPSAGNRQPWHFYAISDRELIGRIANESLGQSFAAKAPLMIVVCADALAPAGAALFRRKTWRKGWTFQRTCGLLP